MLNLGVDFPVPKEQWKELADRIEAIVVGQSSFLLVTEEMELLAQRYAKAVIAKQGQVLAQGEEEVVEVDYQRVDVNRSRE